jgi:hypothetical protein
MPTPALDFCQKVRTWQDAEGASSGLPLLVPARDLSDLDALLAGVQVSGPSPLLEDRARRWLIGYRELEDQQRVLTEAQRAELNDVVGQLSGTPYRTHAPARRKPLRGRVITAAVVAVIALLAGIGTRALIGSGNGSPPPAGPVAAQPAGPQPGALTDLQRFRADWNVPAVAVGSAGNPAGLVLLQDGLYYPAPWGIPAGDAGWVTDTTGSITGSPQVHDGLADVTDVNGTTYTVAVGQPFVLASNPQVVLRVLRNAAVQVIPQPHAIAVRVPVTTKG